MVRPSIFILVDTYFLQFGMTTNCIWLYCKIIVTNLCDYEGIWTQLDCTHFILAQKKFMSEKEKEKSNWLDFITQVTFYELV